MKIIHQKSNLLQIELFSHKYQTEHVNYKFEEKKIDVSSFKNISVDIGADFAIQYQSLNHEASNASYPLIELGSNFNLPTANFNINTVLAPGIKVNLETCLSARHHNETWVKGGYLVIDHLPFLPASDVLMKYLTSNSVVPTMAAS